MLTEYVNPSSAEINPIGPGGKRTCWKGGSSSSSTTSTNIDKRIAISEGVGISADNSSASVTINEQSVDADIVKKALDTVSAADATSGAGFSQLLTLAGGLFEGAGRLIGGTQQAALQSYRDAQGATARAMDTATAAARGGIDNRTLTMIALAGAAAVAFINRKG
jgi:hypothetical protein